MANIEIGGRLHSTATGNVVAGANEILDDTKGKKQNQINAETDATLADHGVGIRSLNSQNYVTVDTYGNLPETGSQDAVYRVCNWDGAYNSGEGQVDSTKYTEYAWAGTEYRLLSVKSGMEEVFDVSQYNATGGSYATYESFSDLLTNHLADIPVARRKGGMSIKFVQSSDNKYVQYRYMESDATTAATFTNVTNWQGIDTKPETLSKNLAESGGIDKELCMVSSLTGKIVRKFFDYTYDTKRCYIYGDFKSGNKITISVDGTAVINANSINVRYDDIATSIGTMGKETKSFILSRNTGAIVLILLDSNITTDGTLSVECIFGNSALNENSIQGLNDLYSLENRYLLEGSVGESKLHTSALINKHIVLFVSGGVEVEITANSSYATLLAALRQYPTSIDDNFVFSQSTGFTSRIQLAANTMAVYSLPQDVKCVVISAIHDGERRLPVSIKVDGIDITNSYLDRIVAFNKLATVERKGLMSASDKYSANKLSEYTSINSNIIPSRILTGYYVHKTNGFFSNSIAYSTINKTIVLKSGEKIIVKLSSEPSPNVSVISSCPFYGIADQTNISSVTGVHLTPLQYDVEGNTYSYKNDTDNDMYIVVSGYNNDIRKGYSILGYPCNYETKNTIIYEKDDEVFEFTSENTEAHKYIKSDGTVINDPDTSYALSDYIFLNEGVYKYDGNLSGNAAIVIYNLSKERVSFINNEAQPIVYIRENGGYIRVSVLQTPKHITAYENIVRTDKIITSAKTITLTDNIVVKNGNVINISDNDLTCNLFRLSAEFKIAGYAEQAKNVTIASIGNIEVKLNGDINSVLSRSVGALAPTSKLPVPKRNVKFSATDGTTTKQTNPFSLPYFREIIGKDVFSIQYVGEIKEHLLTQEGYSIYDINNSDVQSHLSALNDKMMLSFINGTLTVSANGTTYINEDLSGFSKASEAVSYLNSNYPDFECKVVGDSNVSISDLADIQEVYLVSKYSNVNAVTSAVTRYDAYPCYFQQKIDNTTHNLEVTNNCGKINIVVDGIPVGKMADLTIMNGVDSVAIGSNDADIPIVIENFELNIGTLADAEPQSNGRIISNYNPSVVILEGHGIFPGAECNGKYPVAISTTPSANEDNVIPDDYVSVLNVAGGGTTIAMSTSRYERICELAKNMGYKYIKMADLAKIHTNQLPKRCWTICFDDREEFIFTDLKVRQAFGKTGIFPALAISYSIEFPYSSTYIETHNRMLVYGCELVQHGLLDLQACLMNSAQLYDSASKMVNYTPAVPAEESLNPDGYYRRFGVQMDSAEMIRSNASVWVYSNGVANANTFKGLANMGVSVGVTVNSCQEQPIVNGNIDRYSCRGSNKYYLRRLNVSDKDSFSKLEELMV